MPVGEDHLSGCEYSFSPRPRRSRLPWILVVALGLGGLIPKLTETNPEIKARERASHIFRSEPVVQNAEKNQIPEELIHDLYLRDYIKPEEIIYET